MRYFSHFIWNDAVAYMSASVVVIGAIVVLLPVAGMPDSYGHWIAALGGAVFACRIAKSAILLRFGLHAKSDILERYTGFRGVAKIRYSFKTETDAVVANWQSFDQQGELLVSYWKSCPSFHIAYWNSDPNEHAG